MSEIVENPESGLALTAALTVTEAHIVNFAGLTGDFHPAHMSSGFASQGQFGQRIAHGLLVLGLSNGLVNQMRMSDDIAILGIDWKMVRPVVAGDSIHVRTALHHRRLTSSGNRVVSSHRREVYNQNGELVQHGLVHLLGHA